MGNQNLDNKLRCVYSTRELFKGHYASEIEDREDFKGKYDSMLFQISEVYFNEPYCELNLCLEKSNGSCLPYVIVGDSATRQFMSDVVGYSPDMLNSFLYMKTSNLIGKKVEVFFTGGNLKGICPLYNKENYPKNENYLLDYYPYVLSEDDYWKLN